MTFYVLISHLYLFSGEMPIQIYCLFINDGLCNSRPPSEGGRRNREEIRLLLLLPPHTLTPCPLSVVSLTSSFGTVTASCWRGELGCEWGIFQSLFHFGVEQFPFPFLSLPRMWLLGFLVLERGKNLPPVHFQSLRDPGCQSFSPSSCTFQLALGGGNWEMPLDSQAALHRHQRLEVWTWTKENLRGCEASTPVSKGLVILQTWPSSSFLTLTFLGVARGRPVCHVKRVSNLVSLFGGLYLHIFIIFTIAAKFNVMFIVHFLWLQMWMNLNINLEIRNQSCSRCLFKGAGQCSCHFSPEGVTMVCSCWTQTLRIMRSHTRALLQAPESLALLVI